MTATTMIPEIDFLPAEYREKRVRLQMQPWRLVVSLGLVALVTLAAATQYQRRLRVTAELTLVAPQYEAALKQNRRYGELQTELAAARADADLFTYLRYPWPSTRILDALLAPLPEEVVLEELQIHHESKRERGWSGAAVDKATEEKQKKMPPAARDLSQLRQQCDTRQTMVLVTGTTRETAALHRYLGELAKTPLFAKAELASIEKDSKSVKNTDNQLRFSATLVVRPGYGQPGGPTPEDIAKSVPTSPLSDVRRSDGH